MFPTFKIGVPQFDSYRFRQKKKTNEKHLFQSVKNISTPEQSKLTVNKGNESDRPLGQDRKTYKNKRMTVENAPGGGDGMFTLYKIPRAIRCRGFQRVTE